MRFSVNFRQEAVTRADRVFHGAVSLLVVALVVPVVLFVAALAGGSGQGADTAESTDAGTIPLARAVDVAAQARILATRIAHQGEASRTVLLAVERALPVTVRLRSFEYDARRGRGALVAVSGDLAELSAFVSDLERQPGMDRIVVSRQLVEDATHVYEVALAAEK